MGAVNLGDAAAGRPHVGPRELLARSRRLALPLARGLRLRPWSPSANERYRRLVELSPDGIFISQDARIVFVNPAAVRLFGAAAPEQILGRSLWELFHPGSHAPHPRTRRSRAGRRDGAASPKKESCGSTAASRDVEVTSTLLDGDDGGAIQVIVRDITERKRTEAALRESEERLALAFAGAQEGVWDWNLETGAVVYSPRWKQMLGYARRGDRAARQRLGTPAPSRRPSRAREQCTRASRAASRPTKASSACATRTATTCTCSRAAFRCAASRGGPVVRIVGTHFDLTERKRAEAALRESEERLTLAFAGAQEGVWDWNLETGAVVYSPRWKADARLRRGRDRAARQRVGTAAPSRRLAARATACNESVARGAPTYEGEFRLRHKDGHYVHVLSRGFPVRREPGGPVVRIVGTHFDLTERKQAEAERARTELLTRLVFAQEDERRRIAREMHDQFGEQLTALGRGIGMLKDACRDRTDLRDQVEALEAVAQQLDRDVDHLVWELRPTALDDLGLRAALANYVQDWSQARRHRRRAAHVRACSTIGSPSRDRNDALPHRAGSADQRRQARARRATSTSSSSGAPTTSCSSSKTTASDSIRRRGDAGQGFGLLGMQERAALVGATLEIESAAGQGHDHPRAHGRGAGAEASAGH